MELERFEEEEEDEEDEGEVLKILLDEDEEECEVVPICSMPFVFLNSDISKEVWGT